MFLSESLKHSLQIYEYQVYPRLNQQFSPIINVHVPLCSISGQELPRTLFCVQKRKLGDSLLSRQKKNVVGEKGRRKGKYGCGGWIECEGYGSDLRNDCVFGIEKVWRR